MLASPGRSHHFRLTPEQGISSKLMITTFKSARRNIMVATALLATAGLSHGAKIDTAITASQATAQAANIEDVVEVARNTANQIGSNTIKLNPTNTGALARFMSEAILAKQTTAAPENRLDNKIDELVESLANIVQGISSNPKFQKTLIANTNVKTIMNQGLRQVKKDAQFSTTNVFVDAARSVMLTIANNPAISDKLQTKIFKFLNKSAKSIAGKPNKAGIKQGLAEGNSQSTDPVVVAKSEDANQYPTIHQVNDPETDFRQA